MSIDPFDPTAGDYGSLNYVDPFGDTTADVAKSTIPAKVSVGNVGISPITTQGAVSIPAEPSTTTYSGTGNYYRGTGPSSVAVPDSSSLKDALTTIADSTKQIRTNTFSSFDPGNRMPGFQDTSSYITSKQGDLYSEYFKENPADLIRKGEDGSIQILNIDGSNNRGMPNYTTLDTLNKLGYDRETTSFLSDGKWQGSPEIGEYYTFKPTQPDAFEKYGLPLITAAISIANPVAGAFWAGSQTAMNGGDIGDVAKSAAGAYLGGQAGAGNGMFAGVGNAVTSNATLASAISAGTASGVATAVQGGDLGDVVKSGLLGGAGGAISSLGQEAAALEQAAQTAGAAGDFSNSVALTMQANELASQANLISTITNSAKAVDAITSGDYASALASGMQAAGTNLTEFTSNQLTGMFGEEAFANLNIDDVAAGVNKVATSLAEGKDIEEALQKGVTTYIQQGGSLGESGDQVRDYLESAGGALYDKVIKPAGDMLTGLVDNVSSFDTPEGIEAIEDAVKQAGAVVDDKVLQPIKEGAESIYEPLSGPDVNLPTVDVNLPDVNLPDVNVDLPSMDLSGMFDGLMAYLPSQRTRPAPQQQTTDPVLADLSDLYIQQAEPEELLATRDYLSGLLRTI
jgi:hypothetical protein